jgi:hypothetical protein
MVQFLYQDDHVSSVGMECIHRIEYIYSKNLTGHCIPLSSQRFIVH